MPTVSVCAKQQLETVKRSNTNVNNISLNDITCAFTNYTDQYRLIAYKILQQIASQHFNHSGSFASKINVIIKPVRFVHFDRIVN